MPVLDDIFGRPVRSPDGSLGDTARRADKGPPPQASEAAPKPAGKA